MKKTMTTVLAVACLIQFSTVASAQNLFNSSDIILAVDLDSGPDSGIPGAGEAASQLTDQNSATKYLNFGKQHTGAIITPAFGSSIVQSLQLTTANDADGRDPLSYRLYGTNDAITSTSNSFGDAENWSLISTGDSGLAGVGARFTPGTIQDFANGTAYTSYKISFPTIKNAFDCCMQVADLSLFTGAGGSGSQILAGGDAAIEIDDFGGQSNYPGSDNPSNIVDGTSGAKYLNFAKEFSGVIIKRADGLATVVDSLTFTTGNDVPERDPLTWDLYGTDDPISSLDNSVGAGENWTLVDSGITGFDTDPGREATGAAQAVANSTAYGAYRLVFPTQRQSAGIGEIQIGEVLFEGSVVPEPTSLVLALIGLTAGLRRRK